MSIRKKLIMILSSMIRSYNVAIAAPAQLIWNDNSRLFPRLIISVICIEESSDMSMIFFQGFNPLRTTPRDSVLQSNWFLVAIGFGSLLFVLQWVFGDLSVVSRWASNGYPNQAPDPIPYG